jgi:tRNA G37 N-methylase Trm5
LCRYAVERVKWYAPRVRHVVVGLYKLNPVDP